MWVWVPVYNIWIWHPTPAEPFPTTDPPPPLSPPPPPPPPPPEETEDDPDGSVVLPTESVSATSFSYPLTGLIDLAWEQHPHRVLWGARSDGLLIGMTYMPDQQIAAWHRHPMTNGTVESVCVVPSPSESSDRLWMVVRRTIDGQTVRYVEHLTAEHEPATPTDTTGYCYLDCSIVYDGPPAMTLTGLDHLEGETVAVWGDGVDRGDHVVSGGEITLAAPAVSTAAIGLNSPATLQLLPLETGAPGGVGQGRMKVIERATVRLEEAGGISMIMPGNPVAMTLPLRTAADLMDTPPPLFTGDVAIDPATGWEETGQIAFAALRPHALTINMVVADVHVASR